MIADKVLQDYLAAQKRDLASHLETIQRLNEAPSTVPNPESTIKYCKNRVKIIKGQIGRTYDALAELAVYDYRLKYEADC